jgi:hypothetical protein
MRHRIVFKLIALMFTLGAFVIASAQMQMKPIPQEARAEATRSLPQLQQLVTPESYKALGFQSVAEAKSATLEAPVQVFMVQLDRLREYQPSASPHALLTETNELKYPVSVNHQVRTSMVMRQINGKWQVASFGRPVLTKALTETIQEQAEKTKASAASFFEVKIPALNLVFVARQEGSRLLLTPVIDDPRFELKQGQEVDAQQLFARLVPYAKELKTGPYLSD